MHSEGDVLIRFWAAFIVHLMSLPWCSNNNPVRALFITAKFYTIMASLNIVALISDYILYYLTISPSSVLVG